MYLTPKNPKKCHFRGGFGWEKFENTFLGGGRHLFDGCQWKMFFFKKNVVGVTYLLASLKRRCTVWCFKSSSELSEGTKTFR